MHHKTGTIHGLATKIDMIFRDFITQFRNTYEKIQQGHMENPKQMFTSGGIDNFMETRKEIFNAIPMLKKPGILGKLEHRTPMINLGEAWKNKGIKLYKKALDAGFQADVTNTS